MLKSYIRNQSGNIAITSAIAILTILTGIGMAIDITNVLSQKESLQDVNDIATLAAVNFNAENKATANANSLGLFTANKDLSQLENTQYNVSFDDDRVTGTATADYPLFFANILPRASLPIRVKTVVSKASPQRNLCIKALNPTAQFTFRLNSGAQLIAPDCDVEVDSLVSPAADFNSGVRLDVARACIAGQSITNRLGMPDIIQTDCAVNTDPYANQFPVPNDDCDFTSAVYSDRNLRLRPGVYCGGLNLGPSIEKVTFDPGVYVIRDGTWTVDGGEWEGDGITFYFMDQRSGIQFNSGVAARLTPPTSGPYANVFITEAPNLPTSNFVINDTAGFDFEGVIYLPSRQLIMNGGATVRSRGLGLVADRIIINDAVLNIAPLDGSAISGPTTQAYIAE